jgi:hypothetical protein
MEENLCRIEASLGRREACPQSGCPFWSSGAEARQDHCAFEGLDLQGRAELARWLHELRASLSPPDGDAPEARRFYERLNAGRAD